MEEKADLKRVAIIAAHPDDEVLGCGGTIAKLCRSGASVNVLLLADGETSRTQNGEVTSEDAISKRISSAYEAAEILGVESVSVNSFPDNRMDSVDRLDVVKAIEEFIREHQPTMIITHHDSDVNIDHRIVHDAVVVACRPQPQCVVNELLFFEVPSSTEWRPAGSKAGFSPNVFFDISDTLELKIKALEAYSGELREFPHSRSLKAIRAMAIWRGSAVGVEAAEAFVLGRKIHE